MRRLQVQAMAKVHSLQNVRKHPSPTPIPQLPGLSDNVKILRPTNSLMATILSPKTDISALFLTRATGQPQDNCALPLGLMGVKQKLLYALSLLE